MKLKGLALVATMIAFTLITGCNSKPKNKAALIICPEGTQSIMNNGKFVTNKIDTSDFHLRVIAVGHIHTEGEYESYNYDTGKIGKCEVKTSDGTEFMVLEQNRANIEAYTKGSNIVVLKELGIRNPNENMYGYTQFEANEYIPYHVSQY